MSRKPVEKGKILCDRKLSARNTFRARRPHFEKTAQTHRNPIRTVMTHTRAYRVHNTHIDDQYLNLSDAVCRPSSVIRTREISAAATGHRVSHGVKPCNKTRTQATGRLSCCEFCNFAHPPLCNAYTARGGDECPFVTSL